MASAPIILVPGFWLGAWAWGEVASFLRADGHDVTALTLPGLESPEDDRSKVTLSDHVDAIVETVKAAGRPVVLAFTAAPARPVTQRATALPSRSQRWFTSTRRRRKVRSTRASRAPSCRCR